MSNELQVQQKQISTVNDVLKEFKDKGWNIVGNETYINAPPPVGFINAYQVVNINKDPRFKEVYVQKGGGLSLTAVGLKKLGMASGIKFGPGQLVARILNDEGQLVSIIFRSLACVRGLDGQFSWSNMDYEFDVTKRAAEIENTQRKNVRYWTSLQQGALAKAPPDFKACKTDQEVEAWVKEQVRVEMIQIEKNALTRAQTGSQTRCIRDLLAIPSTYMPEQLDVPFLIVKLVVYFEASNPIDRAFALEQTKVPMMMFPSQVEPPRQMIQQTPQVQAIEAQAPIRTDRVLSEPVTTTSTPAVVLSARPPAKDLNLPTEMEAIEIEQMVEPQLTAGEQGIDPEMRMSQSESALLDFNSMSGEEQAQCLQWMIGQKKWGGKLVKTLVEFTPAEKKNFFLMLQKLETPTAPDTSQPWQESQG